MASKRKNYVEGGQKALGEYAKPGIGEESWKKLRRWQEKREIERNAEDRLHELSLLKTMVERGELSDYTLDRQTISRLKRIKGSVEREKQFRIKIKDTEDIRKLDAVLNVINGAMKRRGL